MSVAVSWKKIGVWLALAGAVAFALLPPAGLTALQARSAAVVVVTLILWATATLPPFLTSLIFFALVLILGLGTPDLVFSGFGSAAVWLVVSGFVIGAAISLSGLGDRLAGWLAPLLAGSYARLIGGLTLAAMALGFVMPSSTGRSVALIPIGMALAEPAGFAKGSNGRIGIAVALTLACNMPSFAILPSNIPNMILSGATETLHGLSLRYVDYLLLHYPVLGLLKSALAVLLVLVLFPARVQNSPTAAPSETKAGDPALQKRVGALLLITVGLWMTDAIHGINSAWIGLATAITLMMPKIGVVPAKSFNGLIDFGTLLFVAGALGLGALVNHSGLGALLGGQLQQLLPLEPGQGLVNFLSLSVLSTLIGLVATVPGVPTVLTPMAGDLATASGFGLMTVLMIQVIGFSTVVFPYQVGPLVVAMQLSGERLGHVLRITLPLAALTLLLLVPLDYLWWLLLGWL